MAGVSDERRDLDTAGRLGYRHNAVAEDLAAKRRSTVDLYQLDFRNEVFTDAATLMLPDSRLRGLVPSVPLVYVATSRRLERNDSVYSDDHAGCPSGDEIST